MYIYNSIFHNEYNMIKLMLSIYATFKHRSLRLEIIKKRTDKYKSYSKVVLSLSAARSTERPFIYFAWLCKVPSILRIGRAKKSSIILDRNNLTHDHLTGRLRAESRPGC